MRPEDQKGFLTSRTSQFGSWRNLMLHTLEFLRSPPGNHFEALKGKRKGQHSIRVNDQFRVCFRWTKEGPADVEIVDYH